MTDTGCPSCGSPTAHRPDCTLYDLLPEIHRTLSGGIICCLDGICYVPDARWHGTRGGYLNHSCRCAPCTEAWAISHYDGEYDHRYRARRLAEGYTASGGPRVVRQREYRPRASARTDRRPNKPLGGNT